MSVQLLYAIIIGEFLLARATEKSENYTVRELYPVWIIVVCENQYDYKEENYYHNATLLTASLMALTSSSSPGHAPSSRQPTISQM